MRVGQEGSLFRLGSRGSFWDFNRACDAEQHGEAAAATSLRKPRTYTHGIADCGNGAGKADLDPSR